MKTAIIYTTKYGSVEKVARKLAELIDPKHTDLILLERDISINLQNYDCIILGGSIHAGRIQKKMKAFCESNMVILLEKKVGLFICCMFESKAEEQLQKAYPEVLNLHAISREYMGGEFNFERMNFVEKMLVRKISGVSENISQIDDLAIGRLANKMIT
jgi:menaquinone-dependent protoporphyrinogen oxidase